MIPTKAYAVHNATGDPTPWSFEHRDPGPHEILIDIH
jgi:D-arabinose 1-dehydrogenase-like Zn-dependent alcohol dehydrogenase